MKILHTAAFYHPRSGGAEEVVRQLSERLAARGHDVTVATTALEERRTQIHNGVKIAPFHIHGLFGHSAIGIRGESKKFRDFLHDSAWDIILNYAAQTWTTDLTCRELTTLKSKTVLAPCGYSGLIGLRRLAYTRYFQRLPRYLRQYSALVYHSAAYQDRAFGDQHGIKHFRVIPNGIDPEEFAAPKIDFFSRYNITTPYLIVTIGNHFTNKGHQRVIEAFAQIPNTTLVIIGNPSAPWFRGCHKACTRAAGANQRILLLENAPRAHTVAALLAADLFLSGSHIEVFPLVILEAIASHTPWIAFPAGNIAELPGGIVVESIDQMAAEARRLLRHLEARLQLADQGYAQQQNFHWDAIADQYENLYHSLLVPSAAPAIREVELSLSINTANEDR